MGMKSKRPLARSAAGTVSVSMVCVSLSVKLMSPTVKLMSPTTACRWPEEGPNALTCSNEQSSTRGCVYEMWVDAIGCERRGRSTRHRGDDWQCWRAARGRGEADAADSAVLALRCPQRLTDDWRGTASRDALLSGQSLCTIYLEPCRDHAHGNSLHVLLCTT